MYCYCENIERYRKCIGNIPAHDRLNLLHAVPGKDPDILCG